MYYTNEHLVAYPVEYIAGIDLYNAGEYHAAHDAWEERSCVYVARRGRLSGTTRSCAFLALERSRSARD
ncbi:MAG: hypothetical protein DMF75_12785 [Acidobacteria bacterium]|nr:MAG: hypothetical protein DMF75_12785 [Acidobacteriota bacterium]